MSEQPPLQRMPLAKPKKKTKTRQIANNVKSIKRLFLDIETAPNIGVFWRPGDQVSLSPDNITKERAIICAGWKWQGEARIHAMTWDADQDDRGLVKRLARLLGEADEIVAHNGDRFDLRWIRGRALKYGFPVSPFLVTVDTLKIAQKYFELNSHRLDYLGKYLGLGGKIDTGKMGGLDLWKRVVIQNDRKALADMVRYNKRDVELLEQVYDKLYQYAPAKTSVTDDVRKCPSCGAANARVSTRRRSAAGQVKVQLQCLDCNRFFTVSATKFDKES